MGKRINLGFQWLKGFLVGQPLKRRALIRNDSNLLILTLVIPRRQIRHSSERNSIS